MNTPGGLPPLDNVEPEYLAEFVKLRHLDKRITDAIGSHDLDPATRHLAEALFERVMRGERILGMLLRNLATTELEEIE